jgi:hypothetical protein
MLSLVIIFFVSCQKEVSDENLVTSGGTAKYSFDGGAGICTGIIVSGNFIAGTAVTSSNTATVTVNVDSVGSYIIATNTVN